MVRQDNISIVLVAPRTPGNIGSAARAMKNMGLSRLRLVRPCDPQAEECRTMAVGAFDLVEAAEIFDHFDDAVADQHLVVGTTSYRGRKQRIRIDSPRALAPTLARLATTKKIAVVFGPERAGLTEDQIARCQHLVSIPSNPEFPTLNLAQAVLVVAYDLLAATTGGASVELEDLASQDELTEMFRHLEEALTRIGFLSTSNPAHIMRSVRRLLSKAELTRRDVRILRGMARQMLWFAEKGQNLDPERVKRR